MEMDDQVSITSAFKEYMYWGRAWADYIVIIARSTYAAVQVVSQHC